MTALLAGGLQTPGVATLVFSAVAALLALASAGRPPSIRKTGVSALAMALLGILVVLLDGHVLLAAALLLAAFGEALAVQDRLSAYLASLGVQLAVRAVYCVLFAFASQPALLGSAPWRSVAAVAVAAGAAWLLRRIWPFAGPLRWPALIYALASLAMCLTAATVAPPAVLAGAVLLSASDAGTAVDRFLRPRDRETPLSTLRLTFLARYLGQALVVLAGLGLI